MVLKFYILIDFIMQQFIQKIRHLRRDDINHFLLILQVKLNFIARINIRIHTYIYMYIDCNIKFPVKPVEIQLYAE